MRLICVLLLLVASEVHSESCQFKDVSFVRNFDGARLTSCTKVANQHFALDVAPENRPINNSPWYAFQVSSNSPATIRIDLRFDGNAPRYLPKRSDDGQHWDNLEFEIKDKTLSFAVKTVNSPVWIAGQELLDNAYSEQLIAQYQQQGVSTSILGTSVQGQPIHALKSRAKDSKEWVLFLGRQHPPEVTGALAMEHFLNAVFAQTPHAEAFRQRFNLLVVPNLNPDGVSLGNWRHNANGVDLNRDWKTFVQPETQAVKAELEKIVQEGGKWVFAMDFHSTQQDVFYTMPSDHGALPADIVERWLEALHDATRSTFTVRMKPGNNPDMGVFKQYIADHYGVHAVTYEMGDNTNRALIRHVAHEAFRTLSGTLLTVPPAAFYPLQTKGN